MTIAQFEANELVTRANVNSRITQANSYFPVSITNGGTGGTTATAARTNLGVYTPVLLYENSSGNLGTIVLPDSAANYEFLDFNITYRHCVRIYRPNNNTCLISYVAAEGNSLIWVAKEVSVNGTIITVSKHISGYALPGFPPSEIGVYTDKSSSIYRIIGYKH